LAACLLLALTACAPGASAPGGGTETAPPTPAGSAAVRAAETPDTGGAPEEKAPFTLRVITQTGFNELNVADELGFFREEGIELEYIGVLSKGVTEYQLIEQGELDAFTSSHPPTIAQARLAGIRVKAVAPGMVDNEEYPHVRYLVRADSPIRSLEEAVGKKVSLTSIAPCADGYVKYYLKSRGLDPDQVEFVVLSTPGQQEQSLVQGFVDISTSHPPFAGPAVASGEAREILNTWEIFQSPGAGLSTRGFSEDFIAEHPDVVQGFVNAMYRARRWINNHFDEAKAIVARYLDLAPEDLSSFYYDENKNITPGYIDSWFEISEEIELWNHGDLQPEDVYTNDFVPKDAPASDAALTWNG
jgi:ABC-type nitrate/sulfonate/bicarbonate transport system substrate-binding protein